MCFSQDLKSVAYPGVVHEPRCGWTFLLLLIGLIIPFQKVIGPDRSRFKGCLGREHLRQQRNSSFWCSPGLYSSTFIVLSDASPSSKSQRNISFHVQTENRHIANPLDITSLYSLITHCRAVKPWMYNNFLMLTADRKPLGLKQIDLLP